jgi:hypothetical protein
MHLYACKLLQTLKFQFVFMRCVWLSALNSNFISLNSVNKLIVVTVKCGVLFEVRAEFLSTI